MKKRIYFVVLLVVFVVFGAFTQQHFFTVNEIAPGLDSVRVSEPAKLPPEIVCIIEKYDSILTRDLKETGTVGAAVAITYKNQIAYLNTFGVTKAGTNDSVDAHTIFRLASVSKTVTGVLAGILASENTIELDDKVVDYIPDFRLKNPAHTQSLTIRNLLSHTTGVVPHAYDDLVEHHVPMEKIISRFDMAGETATPGKVYGYQNVLFSLIDTILRAKTSKNYGELAYEKLFKPYGMNDASTDFESFKNNENKAYPHVAVAKNRYRATRLNDRYYSTAPAAGVNASISDMANFLLALMNDNDRKLNKNVHQTVFSPQVNSPLRRSYFRYWDHVDSKQYGIGWRLVGYKGRQVAYHGGYVLGYKAEIALCEEDEVGIAFLTNSPSTAARKSVPEFLNLIFEYNDSKGILTNAEPKNQDNAAKQG